MSYYWYYESLKFDNDLNNYFYNEDLQAFSTKELSNEKKMNYIYKVQKYLLMMILKLNTQKVLKMYMITIIINLVS